MENKKTGLLQENIVKRLFTWEKILLALPVFLYIYLVARYFWALPSASDPLQYLGPAVWGTAWGYWPWLDRIVLADLLRVFSVFFSGSPMVAVYYVATVNAAIISVVMCWAYKKSGFWAAFIAGIFINCSYLMLGWSTNLFPDQTVALFALLAYVFYFSGMKDRKFVNKERAAGFFSALAVFTKITGLAAAIFFTIYFFRAKKFAAFKKYIAGVLAGSALAALSFILFYNWESFTNVVHLFFANSIKDNLSASLVYFNASYYHELLLSLIYFPFILILLLPGAYKNKDSRDLLLFAWVQILLMFVLRQAGPSIPHYFYTAYVFSIAGISIYLGNFLRERDERFFSKQETKITFSLFFLALVLIGLNIGIKNPPVIGFGYGYNYLNPLDIYNDGMRTVYPAAMKFIYAVFPVAIFVSLLLIQIYGSKKAMLAFSCLSVFFFSFSNGGLAYKKIEFDRAESGLLYQYAPALNEVPDKEFTVYIKDLQKLPRAGENLLWIYRVFYDKKYERTTEKGYDAKAENEKLITSSIAVIENEADLLAKAKGSQIITDSPEVIGKYFPGAQTIKRVKAGASELSVMTVSQKGYREENKNILFSTTLDLSKSGASCLNCDSQSMEKIFSPFRNMGSSGEFVFGLNSESGGKYLEIKLSGENLSNEPFIYPGYGLQNAGMGKDDNVFVTLDAEVYFLRSGGNSVFVQDQAGDWEKSEQKAAKSGEWEKYSITRSIRREAANIAAGIGFLPKSNDDFARIRSFKVTVWTPKI